MWTGKQSKKLKEGRKVGSWLLGGLWLTSFKPCVHLFQQLQGRTQKPHFRWRREWTITRLKIRGNFGNYKRRCYCIMTKLPWYVLWAKSLFHFYRIQNQNYSSRRSYKLCSLWSVWTSQIVSHPTWRSTTEIDRQCFNYLGCRWRQNKSPRSSQKAWQVLCKLYYYQMETTRTRLKP